MKLLDDVTADATYSPCGTYRYSLGREWQSDGSTALWLMLNPSTATEFEDDPTVRRTQGFSRSWGCGRVVVANIFALRATNPQELYSHPNPVGPDNDRILAKLAGSADLVIAGWGTHGALKNRGLLVEVLLRGVALRCLGKTKSGAPRHPLYVRSDTALEALR